MSSELIDREHLLLTISDRSKDAYGCRMRLDYASMSDEELVQTYKRFDAAAIEAAEAERVVCLNNQKVWERRIEDLVSIGAGNRGTAIRWDMDAQNADGDVSYYCYLLGIAFSNEAAIERDLAANPSEPRQ